MGAHNIANAHPYNYGNVVGAHNGKITNCKELCEHYGFNY
ncbi:MAG: hypothetical protein IIA17_11000, partial [candidate division Zixibacteria bacterium]|nr:hypothetical protein [candidate division Zixibacteria bacterium]